MISSLMKFLSSKLEIEEAASDLLPNSDEGKAKKKSQGASEISNQGEKGVEKDLLLNLSSGTIVLL